jgi:DNA-binding response OmpR family regulator
MSAVQIVSIEDETDMIELIRLILKRAGYEVIGANGGYAGLQAVVDHMPSLILLDLMMPDVDGWEVYARLKANPTTHKIPVLIVTARAQHKDKLNAIRENGVDDYIIKPFGPAQLVECVQRILARSTV